MEPPLKIAELDHVVLRCRDQKRSFEFYTALLGLKEERRIEQIGLIQLRAGNSMIDLVPAPEDKTESGRNLDHFCLGVETPDFNSLIEYLRQKSVEIIGEPALRYGARGMGRSVYIRDPEGNVIELKELPPGA